MEIKVLSSLATREAYLELVPQFEASSGHKVSTTWAGTADILKRIGGGEIYDIIVSSAKSLEDLAKQGKVASGATILATCGIGMAVRKGATKPDVGTSEAFKQAMLKAKTIGYSTGPSGVYLAGLFERMGIADAVKSKITQVPSGGTVGPIVANGEAEIGFQQVSEIAHADGVDYVGPLPKDIQSITVFSAGLHANAPHRDAAVALVAYLTTPSAKTVMRQHGLETV